MLRKQWFPKQQPLLRQKTITSIIHYVDKVTNQNVKEDVVQPATLSRTKTENKVTGVVTYGEWTTGNWDEVISGKIDKYKDPDIPTVESQEVTSDSSDKEITVRYDRLSTPDKPTPEPGTPKTETPVNQTQKFRLMRQVRERNCQTQVQKLMLP